jgi:Icc-related predicted phosphoesterase
MKISIASDVHLEFGDLMLTNTDNSDVLVLSGDICVNADMKQLDVHNIMEGSKSNVYHDFFKRCASEFKHVVYVVGNHEHYNGDFKYTVSDLKSKLSYIDNLYLLDREVKVIDDVTFVGGTMWTDMNKGDSLTLYHISRMMNDFRCVENSNREVNYRTFENLNKPVGMSDDEWLKLPPEGRTKVKFKTRPATFSPEDAMEEHKKFIEYLTLMTEDQSKKFVVCTHHTPSHQSCHPRYAHDQIMNGGYHSDLSELILDRPNIKLWTHGHTHEDYDYVIGNTRVVCNPRGYIKYEPRASTWKVKTVEV